jgi:hypothetical protein
MAEKEQILLESIFDTACVIEEGMWSTVKDGLKAKFKNGLKNLSQSVHKKASDVFHNVVTNVTLDAIKINHNQSQDAEKRLRQIEKQEEKLKKEKERVKKTRDFSSALNVGLTGILQKHSENALERLAAGENPTGDSSKTTKSNTGTGIAATLLGAGAGAGVAAKALYDKVPEIADETREHIHSLHDKVANMINAHHEE